MKVLVTDILGTPGAHREMDVSFDVAVVMDAAQINGAVSGTVRFDAGINDVMASGRMHYVAQATCVRCLKDFDYPSKATFSQLYAPRPLSDDILPIDDDGTIDLEEPVRDEVVLTLPLTPICRSDCAGLCATCGTDLNSDPCDGHDDVTSSPFAILAQLLDPEEL